MKKALPENAKIAKDAKETVQECVSEFISFITSEYPFLNTYDFFGGKIIMLFVFLKLFVFRVVFP